MRLEKWYADCVSGNEVEIEYRARLQLGPLIVNYSGRLGRDRSADVSIGGAGLAMPRICDGALHWERGGARPPWIWRNAQRRPITLWHDRQKSVVWNPLVLNGRSGRADGDRGYAEKLTLDIAPWRLGIDTLKWGRFCGERHSLVWIAWEGRIPRKIALLDGEEQPLVAAHREEIRTERARLRIANPEEIIREPLGAGALKALGPLRVFATGKFLSGIETKWLAVADLELEGIVVDHGSVVFEEVVWQSAE